MNLSDLSAGEKLTLERRRVGRSQREAAAAYGVSLYRYRAWEEDREGDQPTVHLGRLRPWERCYILRCRAGIPLKDAPARMGVTRWWLCQMEYGRAPLSPALLQFWANRRAKKTKKAS